MRFLRAHFPRGTFSSARRDLEIGAQFDGGAVNPLTLAGLLFETKKRPICLSEADKQAPMGDNARLQEVYCSGF